MKCQILFSGKNKKKFISLLSAEFAQRDVKVNGFHHKEMTLLNMKYSR